MPLKRTSHAVYEAKYHLVWCPKYRKKILAEEIRPRVKELFIEISSHFDFEIDRCEIAEDHIHILISFPPKYSVSRVIGILKSISGSKIFKEFPKVKKQLWGGHFWEQGYFYRTVGEQVTDDVIRKYIENHSFSQNQLPLFKDEH
jgi:putative transposase